MGTCASNSAVHDADLILDESDTVWVNPKFMSILGRALVQANSSDLVKARELFRAAANFGFDDILMLF